MSKTISERTLITLLGAIQFVNVLDFMMVTPLGPDFAANLGIPISQLGLVGGSYAAAAAVAGLAGMLFLDRFDRRTALGVALAGLVVGTAAGGFAVGISTLLLARVIAGLFGGPATSLAMSIISDLIPPARRGQAFGAVMGAFAAASVLGVPAGLWLSRHGGWRVPFFAVAAVGMTLGAACVLLLPPVRGHLERPPGTEKAFGSLAVIFRRPETLLSLLTVSCAMLASFLLLPNIASYFQFNCHVPRDSMEQLYAVGGVCSFVAMRMVGRFVDRFGCPATSAVGTLLFVVNLGAGFLFNRLLVPAVVVMALFMIAQSFRNIAATTQLSQVPLEDERARYQSLQSAAQHIASAVGAVFGSLMLSEQADHSLLGMGRLTALAMLFAGVNPLLLLLIQRQLHRRSQSARTTDDA